MAYVSKHGCKKVPVCKFWLTNRCRRGSRCKFHHAPNSKGTDRRHGNTLGHMPTLQNPAAGNRRQRCPRYYQGFCYLGPLCGLIHVPGLLCQQYSIGYCPNGSFCRFSHPKFGKPPHDINIGHHQEVPAPQWESLLCLIRQYRIAKTRAVEMALAKTFFQPP